MLTKTAEVETNDPAHSKFTLVMKLMIIDDISSADKQIGPFYIAPSRKWRGEAVQGSSTAGLITIGNRSSETIRIGAIRNSATAFVVKVTPLMVGKRYAVQFTSEAGLPVGLHRQTVTMATDSAKTPELVLELEVEVRPAISIVPTSLNFENTSVASNGTGITSRHEIVRISFDPSSGIRVTSAKASLGFLQATVEEAGPGIFNIRVSFTENPPSGRLDGLITIETDNPSAKLLAVPVTVTAR